MSLESYIRSAGIGAAIPNVVINPAIAWMLNQSMTPVPLMGDGSVIVDTAITCVVMTFIVTLFTASAARRSIEAGQIQQPVQRNRFSRLLAVLPQKSWLLGLVLGVGSALIVAPATYIIFKSIGLITIPFITFAVFKAVYTPIAAFFVSGVVILRQFLIHA